MHGRLRLKPILRGPLTLALLLALSAVLSTGSSAFAAETLVNFDSLTAGEVVTDQYEAQGLKLGQAKDFGQTSPGAGDCGSPTVAQEAGIPAASAPSYAVLAKCSGSAGPPFSGTYGALLGHPRGALSVEVRNLTIGTPGVQVTVIGYDRSGQEVISGKGEATTTAWQSIALKLAGAGQISFFMVRADGSPSSIAIDDLAFEKPSEESTPPPSEENPTGGPPPGGTGSTGGGTSTTGSSTPQPPTAIISLQTPNPGPGEALTLSGASSQPGSGHIISYDWDLNGDGKIDTSTGTNPVVHLILAPGAHTVGLTVTNSGGQSSSSKFNLTLPNTISAIPPPDGGQGPCEPTLQEGDAQIIAECIQKSGAGYVIESKQLGLNGMELAPQGGGYGVFKIQTVKDIAIGGSQTLLSGTPVNIELLNTPIGDVVLGGRDLESEPIQLTAHSSLGQHFPALNHGLHAPRAHSADDEGAKTLLMAFGVGHECSGGSKQAGCCPPAHENTACATLPGNFPLTGQVVVYLTNKGQSLFDVQVGLELKGIFEATGALEIEADPQAGINLNSLKFSVPEAGLESIFTVKQASFVYYFPSDPEESKRDTWQAKGKIVFGPLGEPSLEGELAFKKGQFHSASLVFLAPPPGVPIYPGIALNKLGGSVGVEPFSFGGTIGASIATQLELTLSFKYREASGEELGFFGGQGQLAFKGDDIATLAADVYSDGYVDAQLKINLQVPFESDNPIVKVEGGIGFWDEPASGLWQAEGNVYLKLWEIHAGVAGLVNNQYVAGCAEVNGFGAQARYSFSDSSIGVGLFGFSNCSDQLKQYKQKPLKTHSGGFVGGESLRFPSAHSGSPLDNAALSAHTAAGTEGDSFALPAGKQGEELRITSATGTPVVTFVSPSGQHFTTPAAAGTIVSVPGQFIAAVAPNHDQVLVLLRHPAGGQWHLQPAAGSPPLGTLEAAEDVKPATVHAHARHGHGRNWTLAYKIANFLPGTKVRFVERGRDSTHVLGVVSKATGSLRFTPQDALGRSRKLFAYLLNNEGAPVRVLTAGQYIAPSALRGGRVRGLRIVRRGTTASISWGAASGARLYRIEIHGSDGRLLTLFRKPSSRSVQLANVLSFERFSVSVSAKGGPNLLSGPVAKAELRPLKLSRHPAPKRRAGKH